MNDSIRFWGVRGSIASPGPGTALVGGNTSCVEVRLGGERLILDGGTGLRQLGHAQAGEPVTATILFSHLHWDHIQGIPFFGPLYDPSSRIRLVGPAGLAEALERQMSRPSFPVGMDAMGAERCIGSLAPGQSLRVGDVLVECALLPHPGGSLGYRLSASGRAVVFATDVEHTVEGLDESLLALADGADVLVYDAQYLPEEYAQKRGWGHSTYEVACTLARRAGVRQLFLTHHDPARDDAAVMRIERAARLAFASTHAAREGTEVHLASGAVRSVAAQVDALFDPGLAA